MRRIFMYKIHIENDVFSISRNGCPVVEGIKPQVTLDGEFVPDLVLKSFAPSRDGGEDAGEMQIYTLEYTDSEGFITLTLRMECQNDLMAAYVDVRCKEEAARIFTLASEGSVKLKVCSIGDVEGLMANYLFIVCWTRPHFKKDISELPAHTQSLLWKSNGLYHYLLPVCDDLCRTQLGGSKDGGMDILVSTHDAGYSQYSSLSFILGTDRDPFQAADSVVHKGLELTSSSGKPREERRYPEILEYLGWCSWDAFYHDVNQAGVLEKAGEFKKLGLPVKWFVIDDGWSQIKDKGLYSFEEDRTKFPDGLAFTIKQLKESYGVNWVGVWHAFCGYWGGINPDGIVASEMKDFIYRTKNGKLVPYPDASRGFAFWNAWHSYLKNQGVDFVKVDHQNSLSKYFKDNVALGAAAREAHQALEASLGINFDSCVINCMGMAAENLWHRPNTAVARNSDDFFPKKPGSFREHALQNAYNSFCQGRFIWGDWDMWWTQNDADVNNSVLRAVSGGPVYVSDPVGKTSPELLWPLILSDGRVLRCDLPGMPTLDCLTRDPSTETVPLKIWNRAGEYGIIAAFNINKEGSSVEGTVSPSDVAGLEGEDFILYEYFSGTVHRMKKGERLPVSLEDFTVSLYLVAPVKSGCTPLGLINKYVSPAAIMTQQISDHEASIILKEGGQFGFVCDGESRLYANGEQKEITIKDGLCVVDLTGCQGPVHIIIEIEKGAI
jgi:raffinose synthase